MLYDLISLHIYAMEKNVNYASLTPTTEAEKWHLRAACEACANSGGAFANACADYSNDEMGGKTLKALVGFLLDETKGVFREALEIGDGLDVQYTETYKILQHNKGELLNMQKEMVEDGAF